MLKKIALLLLLAVNVHLNTDAQCIPMNVGPSSYNLACGINCTDLTFTVPDIRQTSDYTIRNIPYAPFAYTTPTGNEITSIYIDDQFSDALNSPFPICFYGSTFNQFIVGSNGVVSFDMAFAGCKNAYRVNQPIPFEGAFSCSSITGPTYPKNVIMGPYYDIDPSVTGTSPNRKIEWRVEGTTPCRRLIVSFSEIPLFGSSCTSLLASQQIVVHEATGIVDIFIGNRPTCPSWESGRAILGIQKDQNTALPVPGKNAVSWTESNTGYQYFPSGGTSQLQAVQIIKGGTVVGTGTIGASANGEATITFPNYCATTNRDTLEIKAVYRNCADPNEIIYGLDTIVIIKNPGDLLATAAPTPATCTASNGSITVNVPPGAGTPPFQYSINGGPLQSGNTFTGLASGAYTLFVRDFTGSCTSTINVVLGITNPLNITPTATNTACAGVSNGSISVATSGAVAPIQYSINGGPNQASNVFNGLAAGTYTITVTDGNGCARTSFVTVSDGPGIIANVVPAAASCAGANNGSITINPLNGTAPYQYSINGGALQAGNVFTGLTPGLYTVAVRDFNGCTTSYTNINVTAGTGIAATAATTPANCSGPPIGSITVTPSTGVAPYQYQLNTGAFQPGSTFSNLAAGSYTVNVRDFNNCTVTLNVTVPTVNGVTATATSTAATCAAATNGVITVNVTAGTPAYQYALDGGAQQPSNIFNNVAPGNHSVVVTDGAGCVVSVPVTVAAGPGISATATPVQASCAAATNGSTSVNVTVGTAPYQYSLNGGPAQPANTFTGLAPGNYTVLVTDFAGCTRTLNVVVPTGAGITATGTTTATSCNGAANGTITITPANGTAPYQYRLDGGAAQATGVFTGVAAGNHSVQVTDFNNCTFTVNITVAAGGNLTGTTAITNVLCNGGNNGAVTVTPTNGGPGYEYSLDGGAFQVTPTFNGLLAGNHTIQLRDANNCTGSITFTITEPAPLTINTATAPATCNGQPNGSITITGGGGTTPYEYSINGVAYQPGNVFNVGAGNYNVFVRDGNGCINSAAVTVTQPGLLQLSATASNATCNGGNDGVITATATGGNGGLQYSVNGGNFQTGNTFNVAPGPYTVTVRDANNCTATTNITVGLTNDLVLATRTDTTICESQSVTLTTQSNGLSFAWTPGAGLSDSMVKNPVATPQFTTQYIVTATYGRCTAKDTVVVTVNPAPVPDAGPGITICFGKTYQLQGSGGTQFFWRPASLLSNANIASPVADPRTTTVFYLRVTDANGCQSLGEDTAKVIVTPPIVASAGRDTTVIWGEPFQLTAVTQNVLPAGTSYLWSPATGLDNPNIFNPKATLFADQVYRVDITTPEGCKGSATVRLKAYKGPDIYVPTGFSPNGDGRNDVFFVVPIGIKEFDYLRIYNRWGQQVFETKLPAVGWEGKFRATEQPPGVYIYTVQGKTEKGKVIFKKGSLLLIR